MLKRAIGTGLCTLALGLGAAQLYGDGAVFHGVSGQCADGSCTPRRITNGYYPTKWRPWPVTPPAPPKRGIQGAIPPAPFEVPTPENEAKLPEGTLAPPPSSAPPSQQPPAAEPPGPGAPNGAPPPRRETTPTPSAPEPGLPPELRNDVPSPRLDGQGSLMPFEPKPLGAPSRAAQASLEQPAEEQKSHTSDSIWRPAVSPGDRTIEREPLFPQTQFDDLTKMPLHAPIDSDANAAESAAATRMGARLAALRQTKPVPLPSTDEVEDSAVNSNDSPRKISVSWNPSRNLQLFDRTHDQGFAAPVQTTTKTEPQETNPQPVIRVSATGPNSPVALGGAQFTTAVRPALAISDTSAAARPAYAVQTSAHSEWSGSVRVDNPLRGQRTEQNSAFESREMLATDVANQTNDRDVDLEAPANPLR